MNTNHHGFVSFWLAPISSGGTGKVWTKIYSDGLQPTTDENRALYYNPANTDSCEGGDGQPTAQCKVLPFVDWWRTDKLRMNGGKVSFTIPSNTPEGKYILRGELLTTYLPDTVATAQGYIGCSALQVGDGTKDDSDSLPGLAGDLAVAIPDAYVGAEWINYHLFDEWVNDVQPANVPGEPGPAAWGAGASGNGSSKRSEEKVGGLADGRGDRRRRLVDWRMEGKIGGGI